jgi:hypothetical protein
MENKMFLREVYRYYFEQGGSHYLFVVLESREKLLGRLYNDKGMMPGFEVKIEDETRAALSSYLPGNPFEMYIKMAGEYIDQLLLSKLLID